MITHENCLEASYAVYLYTTLYLIVVLATFTMYIRNINTYQQQVRELDR